jgi:hypothetical protein
MTPQLWIGFGFAAALVTFLIVSFFISKNLTNDQRATMKFLTALCGGMAAAFFVGDSAFTGNWTGTLGTYKLSGTFGFAVFFVIWLFYPKVFRITDEVRVNIPPDCTFEQAANVIASFGAGAVEFDGFTQGEKQARVSEGVLTAKTFEKMLAMLRLKTLQSEVVRAYEISKDDAIFKLKIKENAK